MLAFSLVLPDTYPFSKRKQRKREKEILWSPNPSERFVSLSLFIFLPIMARVILKLEHMPQTASSIEHLECLV